MRTHINKSLKTRCKAIQTALRKYNAAAKAINRPQLDWSNISTYGSLAEFELLRESWEDIRSAPWADVKNRQAAVHSLRIERAKEEHERLNVEIQSRICMTMRLIYSMQLRCQILRTPSSFQNSDEFRRDKFA